MENEYKINEGMQRGLTWKRKGRCLGVLKCWESVKGEGKLGSLRVSQIGGDI